MNRNLAIAIAVSGLVLFVSALLWNRTNRPAPTAQPAAVEAKSGGSLDEPLQPIMPPRGLDPELVTLGGELFSEKLLSHDRTISCATCHDLAKGGVDGRVHSIGINGAVGTINAPTVLNSGFNFRQFWNGRAATLEEQAGGPVENPAEMGSTWPEVVARLEASPHYAPRFRALYRAAPSRANVESAIATFERSLVTPSRFDRYLLGDRTALTATERDGYVIFKNYGCVSCHQGQNIGGNMYQHFGVMADYFADRGHVTEADLGRYNVTHAEADRYVFKVPSLRNVALTAPYFHDGSAPTLDAAVTVMGHYQLGRRLTPRDIELLVAFLRSLTGPVPAPATTAVASGAQP